MDKIIGISTKKSFGQTESRVVLFKNHEQAEEWLNTEEYDFRDRELFTNEWKAIRALGKGGKKKIAEAKYYGEREIFFPYEIE